MSAKTGMADQTMKIADLFSKCSELAAQEEKEMGNIVNSILPVLAWLNEPVALKPESLGEAFNEFKSVSLDPGALVVMANAQGRVSTKQLAKFGTAERLAILRDSFPELERMIANKRRAGQVRPALSLKLVLGGPHFIVDMRSYRLMVSNSGGDCSGVRISSQLPRGKTKSYRPFDVSRDEQAEVDLGVFNEITRTKRLAIRIDCKDVDGRELRGEESVRPDASKWQYVTLRRKD
jgi:hypothetical protein